MYGCSRYIEILLSLAVHIKEVWMNLYGWAYMSYMVLGSTYTYPDATWNPFDHVKCEYSLIRWPVV